MIKTRTATGNENNESQMKNIEIEITTQHNYIVSLTKIIGELKQRKAIDFRDWLAMRGAEIELEITKRHLNGLTDALKNSLKQVLK